MELTKIKGLRAPFSIVVLLLALLGFATGCGNPMGGSSSQIQAGHDPGVSNKTIAPSSGSEFVAASVQGKPTTGARFMLQGTLSSATNQIMQTTPQRGYKLFSNVQGQFISGGKDL